MLQTVFCELQYQGTNRNKHIYSYNGLRYEVPEGFHRLYQEDPRKAEQILLAEIENRKTDNRFINDDLKRPQQQQQQQAVSSQNKVPTREEVNNSQTINNFKPPKVQTQFPVPSGNNFYFPQSSSSAQHVQNNPDLDSFPTQDTGFNRKIPRERENETFKGPAPVSEFSWNLFKYSNTKPNFVISPLSPQMLLSYLALAADGPTRNELTKVIGYGSPNQLQAIAASMLNDPSNRELQIATAFFVSQDMRINQEFLDRTVEYADLVTVDFRNPDAASRIINRWAKSKTKGGLKIKEVNYAPSTKMALASALYFKGKWVYTFEDARPGRFDSNNGPIETSMMTMKRKFSFGEIGSIAQWVALPYESSDSMVIILPNPGQNVDNVINSLSGQAIDQVIHEMESDDSRANVNITLPKFRMESTTSLVEPLKKMGVSTLFTQQAELPYLSDYDAVQVNNAQQQASMEINEQGTVFIAFTNINVVALSFQAPVRDVEFNVNRPFITMIVNIKKRIPYVLAKISNPLG